ncbi:MAG: NADH-quinone oxidoreductase subunit NuoH [Nevskiales bacterium]
MTFLLQWLFPWLSPETVATVVKVLDVIFILLGVIVTSALLIWGERRLLALVQDRYGPNRVGPFGILQVVADMVKIFFKEDWIPNFVDKPTFVLAPAVAMITVLLAFVVIPITPTLGVVDMNVGLLFFFAMTSLGVYAVMLGGLASNNKYSLLGGLRATAQMLAYEIFMGLALMGVVAMAGSFDLRTIVLAQKEWWFVFTQPLGFVLFVIAGFAATHRTPFDLPEAEHELTAGFHTEYSGMKFGMFMVGEYVGVVLVSALITVLFFGGWLGPTFGWAWLQAWQPFFWFCIKTFICICFFILVRAALPRPRYDQMMDLGWKLMLPLAVLNVAVTGAYVVGSA